eukprot:4805085-Ditylum_brightwellii.AAC.1
MISDLNKAADTGETPLHRAIWYNNKEVVEVLLTHGADVNKAMDIDDTPLHIAAREGHKEVME